MANLNPMRRADRSDALVALTRIPALRADLDSTERAAIDAARRAGASWRDIAAALGLRSRQAAEQRRLRLGTPAAGSDPAAARTVRRRQQDIDTLAGAAIATLRTAAADLVTDLAADLAAELDRPATAAITRLAMHTLRIAAEAAPGALVDLVRLAVADLETVQLRPNSEALAADLENCLQAVV